MMLEPSSQLSRSSVLKRKRRSSNSSESNDENIPWNEEKKRKDGDEDALFANEDNGSSNSAVDVECERLPLSELSLFECKNGNEQDNSIVDLISGQERLSISDCDSNPRSILSETDVHSSFQQELTDDEDDESDFGSVVECYDDIIDYDKPTTSKQFTETKEVYGQLTPGSLKTTPSSSSSKKSKSNEKRLPLPQLRWANSEELWDMMLMKDEESLAARDPDLFAQHPNLQPRMRAVLLDWIIEVCEVYKLHRETYYLTMDYLDRYLTAKSAVPKQQLQLIGITCLLIASKVEEIYPPKVAEFAYVTDGACTEDEILKMELSILKALGWELSPVTVNNWLSTYLQLCYKDKARHSLGFIFPQFAGDLFKRISQLLDLATLDINCLKYSYSILAASCLYLTCSKSLALRVTGLEEEDVELCVDWMRAFWEVLQEEFPEQRKSKSLPPGPNKGNVLNDEHNLLTHSVTLEMLVSSLEGGRTS
ncbi:cyclin E isoform X2 [Lycorma delicatula]|uniref:cyclin E isoform X2 n=1 Tax=Lycorma delicatula TaxID=130591 RepID=UPI003F51579C